MKQKQEAALAALLETGNLTEAAKQAGISRRTLYSYINEDRDFARAYSEARNRQTVTYCEALEARRERASSVIMEIMEDEEQPAAIRLKAAQAIMTAAADQSKVVRCIAAANVENNRSLEDMLGM